MDTNSSSSLQSKKVTKKSKTKKNPIKVVYISNPMKFKTSAAEFRALVQELTGQDAELPHDPSRFSNPGAEEYVGDLDDDGIQSVSGCLMSTDFGHRVMNHEHDRTVAEVPEVVELRTQDQQQRADDFTPQMIENCSGFFPTSVFHESAQMDQVLRGLDTM